MQSLSTSKRLHSPTFSSRRVAFAPSLQKIQTKEMRRCARSAGIKWLPSAPFLGRCANVSNVTTVSSDATWSPSDLPTEENAAAWSPPPDLPKPSDEDPFVCTACSLTMPWRDMHTHGLSRSHKWMVMTRQLLEEKVAARTAPPGKPALEEFYVWCLACEKPVYVNHYDSWRRHARNPDQVHQRNLERKLHARAFSSPPPPRRPSTERPLSRQRLSVR